ncbi:ABC transporter substrate-binding protein [Streptomyces sp. NPDC048504]|uniref:ABC transporter substrate-binding protein n=1 Tax=Streptomyces sp. NPDC048504 TaxID=3365559 RepID=UPI00371EA340
MEPVFEHGDRLFGLLGRLVSRPRKGEAPGEVPGRDGLPILSLLGDHQDGLAEQVGQALRAALPRSVPHESVDMDRIWDKVVAERGDPSAPNLLPPEWQRAEMYRRILVELAAEFSSARYGHDRSVRFKRLGLVNWLLEMTDTAEQPNSQHGQIVLRRLRDRELERRWLFGFMRSPSTEVALQGHVPWWGYLLGLHLLPVIWFRVWRGVGSEYRWLLRQPYMAPGDPGTFIGFAVRLTQPRWGREDPRQISKLMINAFLEDLRVAYRRRPWRRRAHRRTAYCVALLKGVSEPNGGQELVRLLAEVRNDQGAFDPLLLVTSRREDLLEPVRVRQLTSDPGPYDAWCQRLRDAGGDRDAEFWYLPVRVPAPLRDDHPDLDTQSERTSIARRLTVPSTPVWAGRAMTVVVAGTTLALLAAGVAVGVANEWDWQRQHCGLSRSDPDARTVRWQSAAQQCVGVAPHGFAFGSTDPSVRKTLATIARQNEQAERQHAADPSRPLVTLVHLSALLSTRKGQSSDTLSYAREQLQGAASAQYRQLKKNGEDNAPLLRVFPASAGIGMGSGADVARLIKGMMRTDPTIVGVTGLDQSRKATITTIHELTRAGLPMVATTLSADALPDESALYYQVSPQNRREATVAAAYADHLADVRKLKQRTVRVVYSLDRSDEYSANLRADAVASFKAAGFGVEARGYMPDSALSGTSSGTGARTIGEEACGYQGMIFFAGRSEDFETVLGATNDTCGSNPPWFLGGDDVARLGADPDRRKAYPRVPYEFLDFTVGPASCDGRSDLYSTMKELFRDECRQVEDTSLDGHASLAFDAVNLYLKAIARLQDTAPDIPLTPAAVWYALSGIHGAAALDGESGRIDFGGTVDRQVPLDKLISVQRVEGAARPEQMGLCGRHGSGEGAAWCPPSEAGAAG